ncbi:MAG: carbohydrate kinase family protein, partial [Clostridia bacterium]
MALFHFGYPPLMARMYAEDGKELVQLFRRAKETGAATSLDMASVDPDSPEGHIDWKKILERVIPYVDFFVPSLEELCFMLDRSRYYEWIRRAVGGDVTEHLDIVRD